MPRHDDARDVLRELMDLRCRRLLTPRILLWANASLLCLTAYTLIWLVVWAFEQSLWLGLLHVLLAPLGLLAAAVLVRVMLEVSVAVLDMRVQVSELNEIPKRITGLPAMQRLVALGEWRGFSVSRVESNSRRG